MRTDLMLMAKYDSTPMIPVDLVVRDFFSHLSKTNFLRKVSDGAIKLPVVNLEAGSQKSAKAIALTDLASYLDERHAEAKRDFDHFHH